MSERQVRTGERERRFVPLDRTRIELRQDGEGGEPRGIAGLGIPTGVVADIGPFTEEVSREAVDDAIEQGFDIRGLFNHDPNFVLGRVSAGTMSVRATDEGMWFEIPEMPEARSDVMEAIQRGDVDGTSFSFTVPEDGDEWDESGDKPHRKILRFGRVFDEGPVTFPAYGADTVVSARALDHVHAEARKLHEAREKEAERRRRAYETRRRKLILAETELEA